ncbi:MAG: hypothetical protein JJ959_11250 [Nisaea sp.]|uniref:hypothetical protein n=1 Tax=Nisaea sp. TaxID=2024842 RepID=UPI001AFF92FF|nr:hypothetical protein [Nisaea sp.]MBO6561109.1 hypothetical protein [Nisaea sp.]
MEEIPHVGVSYQVDLPKEIPSEFIKNIAAPGLKTLSEPRPIGIYASLEWAMPTLLVVYILKPYFNAFLTEAGSDHYRILKNALSQLLRHLFGKRPETRPKKRSRIFSIQTYTQDQRSLKFIFPEGLCHQDYDTSLDTLLQLLQSHHSNGKTDQLSKLIDSTADKRGPIYVEYFLDEKTWVLIDMAKEISKMARAPEK